MITVSAFRKDYPEFADSGRFPDQTIRYWLVIANLLLNTDRFGLPAPFVVTSEAIQFGGANYAVNDQITMAGGVAAIPAVLGVQTVNGNGAITQAQVLNVGAYGVVPANPVQQQNTSGVGAGATFNLTFLSGPYTAYDYATELYVAHNASIERRALDEAAVNGVPGTSTGPITSKSVDKVSVSYDAAVASMEGSGDLNLTMYGTRLAKLISMFGMGPMTIVGFGTGSNRVPVFGVPGGGCGYLNGPAWEGPITNLGIDWDM